MVALMLGLISCTRLYGARSDVWGDAIISECLSAHYNLRDFISLNLCLVFSE